MDATLTHSQRARLEKSAMLLQGARK